MRKSISILASLMAVISLIAYFVYISAGGVSNVVVTILLILAFLLCGAEIFVKFPLMDLLVLFK